MNEKRTLRVGDKVKTINCFDREYTGVIVEIHPAGTSYPYEVRLDRDQKGYVPTRNVPVDREEIVLLDRPPFDSSWLK